jgi:molybdate transport system ATP-binding protein
LLAIEARTRLGDLDLDVALDVEAGRCLAVAGPSGAGKTTILRIAAGLLRPERGVVRCGERTWLDTAARTDLAPEERRCAYLFQDHALFPHLRAWQNVAYPLRGRDRRDRAHALLERFGVAHRAEARPAALSGGERRRVALARALARDPDALLLDEPLAALDPRTRAAAARELGAVLREAGVPALLVTHDFTEAAELGDAVGVLDGGRIVQRGTATELAAKPASAFVADFSGAVVLQGTAHPGPGSSTRVDLDGGGTIVSTDAGSGPVAATVHPWDIALEPAGAQGAGTAQNRLAVEVLTVTGVGGRVRVGLAAPQPLVAEITAQALDRLPLAPGARATAVWKAAATRLVPR